MKTFKSSSEKMLSKTLDINVGDGEKINRVSSAYMDYMMADDYNVGDAEKIYHASSSDTDYMILDDKSDGGAEIIDRGWSVHDDYMMLDDDFSLSDMKMDELINSKSNNPLRAAIGLDIELCPTAKNRKATRPGLKGFGGGLPSAKNSKLADPKVQPCKPSNRKAAVCREVRQPPPKTVGAIPKTGGTIPKTGGAISKAGGTIPKTRGVIQKAGGTIPKTGGAISKGPITAVKKTTRVVRLPPVIPKKTTGISKAALNYNASDRIKNLAKPKSLPKMETIDKHPRVTITPQALAYKPSLRITQLALPRNRIKAKNSSTLQANAE